MIPIAPNTQRVLGEKIWLSYKEGVKTVLRSLLRIHSGKKGPSTFARDDGKNNDRLAVSM